MSQALYRKWRPARFEEVVGQEHVTRTLRNAIASGRSGHAYLFCGPRGTGKTTTARLLAKAVNCLHDDLGERPCNECSICKAISQGRFLDLIEIDAASNTGVDDIRDLRDKINFSPSEGRFKVYIIDEVHMLSAAAFNALLKTLEEPPPHAKFVLATTEEHKVPMTIKSRCQQFNFRLLTLQEITERLEWVMEQESLDVEPEAIKLIARQGSGSIRDAESLLDQLVTAPGDTITLERAQMVLGTASSDAVAALTDAWLDGDGTTGLQIIHESLASGADVRQFSRQMVDYLRQVLLLQAAGEEVPLNLPDEERRQMLAQAQRATRESLIDAVKAFNEAALTSSSSWQPQLPLELSFIGLLPDDPAPTVSKAAAQPQRNAPAAEAQTPPPAESQAETVEPQRPEPQAASAPQSEARDEPKASPEPQTSETASPAEPAAAKEPAGGAIALNSVTAKWERMVSQVGRQDRNLPALLAVCKPLAVEGNAIVLGFEFPVLKDKFEDKPKAREMVAATMSELLGQKCTVRCVVSSKYTPPAPVEDPAGDDVDRDEFYALADELGGQVRES
ncbi:MAG TPA: DNA polymerase III subunit gamma/tau [Candidatus Sulfomarinibacteraceae bacterium]|nr:DNA polymerase III subunit gamma/tau [Candidatus Sulfomarinibacteraceae bacterium]